MNSFGAKRKADFEDGGSRKSPKTAVGAGAGGKMSLAQKMMAKMGFKEGQGLGKSGEGILNPIEVQLRPQGVGVGAVKEQTKQAKAEAKRSAERRGEQYEDSSEEERKARRRKKEQARSETASGTSTPGRRIKPKLKYQTAADIEAAADGLEVPNVLKSIIDATGHEPKLLTSTAGLMTPGGEAVSEEVEAMKIAKKARQELEAFAESWNGLTERKAYVDLQEEQLQQQIDEDQDAIRKARVMAEAVEGLQNLEVGFDDLGGSTADQSSQWDHIVSKLETMQFEFRDEVADFGLSEVAVAAIHPLFKRDLEDWDPLQQPMHLVPHLRRLRGILGIDKSDIALTNGLDDFGARRRAKSTTPYESLIYTIWLPKVRFGITNSWTVTEPTPLIALVEAWKGLLPDFIYYSLLNNLIVQKLSAAVAEWNPRISHRKHRSTPPSPHVWLFPWLQYLDEHHIDPRSPTGLLADVKRKFRVVLDTCNISAGPIPGLENWREVLRGELDNALIRHLLPRLAALLSQGFEVDPSDQDLTPLQDVFKWNSFFKPSVMGQLLVAEFFPKWLSILHHWLTSEPMYDEIAQWITWWEGQFPREINNVRGVAEQWGKGMEMINQALDLGHAARTDLPPPVAGPARPIAPQALPSTPKPSSAIREQRPAARDIGDEMTFKDEVEAWCSIESLLMIPLREAHGTTGLPLFRITASATGRGGVVVYLQDSMVWGQNRKEKVIWEPFGLDDKLVEKAERK